MKTVLTVDDSKVVRTMVTRNLKDHGVSIIEASNGQEGVEAAREYKPDLILLDVTMPVLDGRQALAELRRDPVTKAIPIIMLTAESGRDLVMEILRLGVVGYIVKPFQKETFLTEVNKVLGLEAALDAPLDENSVLIVDDSDRVLSAARAALERSFAVLTATSGKEALERFEEKRPAVVVIDLLMPDMDGYQTCSEIQKRGRSACVALAVRGDSTAHEEARRAGFRAVIDKPFQGNDLVKQVRRARMSTATPEELLRSLLGEENGCAVFTIPEAESHTLARVIPAFTRTLKSMAEDGFDKLIIDLTLCAAVTAEQVAQLARVIGEAGTLGIRTAICSPEQGVARSLSEIAETRNTPCAPSRERAMQSLR